MGIINGNEADGLLSIFISKKFDMQQLDEYKDKKSNDFTVYCSVRDDLYHIQRIAQLCDLTLVIYDNPADLLEKLSSDAKTPIVIIYDLYTDNKETFESDLSTLGQCCKDHNIWLHLNLSDYG